MNGFNDLQLHFELDGLDDWGEDARDRAISAEEARQVSEAARVAMERDYGMGKKGKKWYEDYMKLREQGWPWRVATYIAWAASPKQERWPRTVQHLATEVLGLMGPRAIYTWREKYPTIDTAVAMMQAQPLLEHRRDVFEALINVAREADYKSHNDRKLFLEMTGDYVRRSQLELGEAGKGNELSEMSEEALRKYSGKANDKDTDKHELSHGMTRNDTEKTDESHGMTRNEIATTGGERAGLAMTEDNLDDD